MDLCTVLLDGDAAVDARKYGDLIARMLGITRLEAKILVRKGRGVFLEDVDEEQARRLVEELARDGVAARCVRNEQLPLLSAPRKVTSVERSGASLKYRWSGEDGFTEIAWPQIDIVSIGAVALPEFKDLFSNVRFDHLPALHRLEGDPAVRDLLRENLILKMGAPQAAAARKKPPSDDKTFFDEIQAQYAGKLRVMLDLVDETRTLWMRVPMDEVAYAYEEGAMKLGEAWGFHLLVQDLRAKCGRAFTDVALKFQHGADIKELVFLQVEEFNRYTFWHAVLHHLGLKPCAIAATSSPSPEPPAPPTDAGSSNASPEPGPPSTSS